MTFLLLLARRIAFSIAVVIGTGFIAFGGTRVLRPDRFPGPWWEGTRGDLERAFLHFDFGCAGGLPGCPPISSLWGSGWYVDLWLLGGALVIAVAAGVAGGAWCAARPQTLRARLLVGAATIAFSTPVYFFGFVGLLLFNSIFGRFPIPYLFDASPIFNAQPWNRPLEFLQLYLVPWLVLAAPLAGMIMRATLSGTREEFDSYHVRTAMAKGLSWYRVVRRHATPATYPSTISFAGASVPLLIANLILVEVVFSVPGFLRYTWRLSGHGGSQDPAIDLPVLQALAIWAAVIVVVVNLLSDLLLARIDPRLRGAPV